MAEWLKGWREQVAPLRRKFGFRIEAAWTVERENRFVWVLSYDGPEGWEAHDAAYYGSEERKALEPDPARHIALAETRFLTPVELPTGG